MGYYNASSGATLATTAAPLRYYPETDPAIVYAGGWASASHPRYAGKAVRYATKAGARATFAFTGTKVVWYGPVGPTRGQARVFIDGAYVKTVNLRASAFIPRRIVFSKSWSTSAKHTLAIQVVGTPGHPMVAIDQFGVAN
jgi:hypothetical protein